MASLEISGFPGHGTPGPCVGSSGAVDAGSSNNNNLQFTTRVCAVREALRYKGRSEPNGWLGQWRYCDHFYVKYVPHLFVYLKKYLSRFYVGPGAVPPASCRQLPLATELVKSRG